MATLFRAASAQDKENRVADFQKILTKSESHNDISCQKESSKPGEQSSTHKYIFSQSEMTCSDNNKENSSGKECSMFH